MTDDLLPCVEIDPPTAPVASVVWMHGLGADGHDFAPVPPQLGLGDLPVRFVFPHAPRMPVTLNMGFVMPAWYDITGLDTRGHDEEGIERSAASIRRLVERERDAGIPAEKIVLAGFSQGGAMALHTGLRYPERLAGIMVLSAYLLLPDRLSADAAEANRKTPIFQAHGLYDPMVQLDYGQRSRALLEEYGYDVEWHEYPMPHSVCPEEIRDIGRWLLRVLDG
jgi:phospholipase/carboxylesterase